MAQPVIPPEQQPMGAMPVAQPMKTTMVETAPVEADPRKDPITAYDIAVESRDPDRMYKIAQANMGTSVEAAALHGAKTIVDNTKKFRSLVSPIEEADTPQKANIAAADAYKTVKDNPKWGTALIKWIMGDKKGAALQVTGGNETDNIVYDKYGKQITETTNDLGQVVNRIDKSTGRQILPDEWQTRGGDVSKIQNTLSFLNEKAIQANNISGLNKTVNQLNGWAPALQAQFPVVERSYSNLKEIKKDDIAAPIFAKALGVLNQSNNNTNTSSSSNSFLQNLSKAAGAAEGTAIDKSITAGINLPGVWYADGRGGITDKKGTNKSISELAQSQNTKNVGSENGKNIASAQENLMAELRATKMPAEKQAMIIDTFNSMAGISKENNALVDAHGKPAFMFLPSSMAGTDRYANGQVQLLQSMFNKEAMDGFYQYYQDHIVNYTPGKAPAPGELEAAYTRTSEYKELQKTYAERAKQDLREKLPDPAKEPNKEPAKQQGKKSAPPPSTSAKVIDFRSLK